MDTLSFLDGEASEPEIVETAPEPVKTPVEEAGEATAKPEPTRDEHGRFAARQDEARPDPVMVPIQALHEARDKLREMEAQTQRNQTAAPLPPQEIPDVLEDQQGFYSAIQQVVYQERLNTSHRFSEQKYGAELTSKALEWGQQRCAQDSGFNTSVMSNYDPVGFVVEQYQRDQVASQVSLDEFEQFKAWKAAQAQAQQQPAAQAAPETSAPPRSLASAPSSGGAAHIPAGPGQAFDSLFMR